MCGLREELIYTKEQGRLGYLNRHEMPCIEERSVERSGDEGESRAAGWPKMNRRM